MAEMQRWSEVEIKWLGSSRKEFKLVLGFDITFEALQEEILRRAVQEGASVPACQQNQPSLVRIIQVGHILKPVDFEEVGSLFRTIQNHPVLYALLPKHHHSTQSSCSAATSTPSSSTPACPAVLQAGQGLHVEPTATQEVVQEVQRTLIELGGETNSPLCRFLHDISSRPSFVNLIQSAVDRVVHDPEIERLASAHRESGEDEDELNEEEYITMGTSVLRSLGYPPGMLGMFALPDEDEEGEESEESDGNPKSCPPSSGEEEESDESSSIEDSDSSAGENEKSQQVNDDEYLKKSLGVLERLGFRNTELNVQALKNHGMDVIAAIDALEHHPSSDSSTESSILTTPSLSHQSVD